MSINAVGSNDMLSTKKTVKDCERSIKLLTQSLGICTHFDYKALKNNFNDCKSFNVRWFMKCIFHKKTVTMHVEFSRVRVGM